MKKRKSFLLASSILLSFGLVTSCNGNEEVVTPKVTSSITISGETSCEVGKTVTLQASITNDPTREGVSWESNDNSIATISEEGVVTALKEGSCEISATLIGDTTIKDSITFTVTASSDPTVEIVGDVTTIKKGGSINLSANVYNPKGESLTYEWATTNGNGLLSSSSAKEVTVIANNIGGEIVTLKVKVGQIVLETSISLYFSEDYSKYTEINSVDKFKELIINSTNKTITGNYCLTNDIDLDGLEINGISLNLTFAGVLDGRGHSIKNYKVVGTLNEADKGALYVGVLFKSLTGTIRNLHLVGKTEQDGVGWGSSILTNELAGTVEDCLVEYENGYNQGTDDWFPFTGAVCGVLKETGVVKNTVINVTGEGKNAAMAITAYPAGGTDTKQTFTVDGVYTNQSVACTFGSAWDWGIPITNAKHVETGLDFSSTSASVYTTLNSHVWNLVDNQMPTLNNL